MPRGSFGRSAYRVSALILLLAAGEAGAAELSLKRVVLSTAGVGYFEYEAEVQGDASLSLDVALDQVDDVLKSLVVFDSGGTAGEITLPGREPQTKILTGTPFEGAASSLADLLNRLTGAELRIGGPSPISGRLVHVYSQTERGPDNVAVTRFRLVLMTDAGLQQMTLDDIGTMEEHLPAEPAGEQAAGQGEAAGLGGAGEFQRPALARRRPDTHLGQPRHVPASAVRELLRQPPDGAGRGGGSRAAAARWGRGCRRPVSAQRERSGSPGRFRRTGAAPGVGQPRHADGRGCAGAPAIPGDHRQRRRQRRRRADRLHPALQNQRHDRPEPAGADPRSRAACARHRCLSAVGSGATSAGRGRVDQLPATPAYPPAC
jgi:hypothetical protein